MLAFSTLSLKDQVYSGILQETLFLFVSELLPMIRVLVTGLLQTREHILFL